MMEYQETGRFGRITKKHEKTGLCSCHGENFIWLKGLILEDGVGLRTFEDFVAGIYYIFLYFLMRDKYGII